MLQLCSDVTFYIVALAMVVWFFLDEKIVWYEAFCLFLIYVFYCAFMKFNEQCEYIVKTKLLGQKIPSKEDEVVAAINNENVVPSVSDHTCCAHPRITQDGGGALATGMAVTVGMRRTSIQQHHRRQSIPILHSGARFRGGIVQLMVHTLDPLVERKSASR